MTFSPDGRNLIVQTATQPSTVQVFRLTEGLKSPATLVGTFEGRHPSISRDGQWIAYEAGPPAQPQIWVRRFHDVGAAGRLVSPAPGLRPAWSPASDELFFIAPGARRRLHVVPVSTNHTLNDSWTPRPLFDMDNYVVRIWRHYDVSADGQRFLMARTVQDAAPPPPPKIVIVERWFDELNRLVPRSP
jgi:hypothetical protein